MGPSDETSWSLVARASDGEETAREEFVRRYEPFVRSYLAARWRSTPYAAELDDAVQDVFLDCFRDGGVLDRAEPGRGDGFRAFLCGVLRVTALRVESRRAREWERGCGAIDAAAAVPAPGESIATSIDRAWARDLLRQAIARQGAIASNDGPDLARRFRMLAKRFRDGMKVGDIAHSEDLPPARVSRELARARDEFEKALLEIVALHHPGTPGEVRREAKRLLSIVR